MRLFAQHTCICVCRRTRQQLFFMDAKIRPLSFAIRVCTCISVFDSIITVFMGDVRRLCPFPWRVVCKVNVSAIERQEMRI